MEQIGDPGVSRGCVLGRHRAGQQPGCGAVIESSASHPTFKIASASMFLQTFANFYLPGEAGSKGRPRVFHPTITSGDGGPSGAAPDAG